MTESEMLELIEAQEKRLRDALAELGRVKARLRKTVVTVKSDADTTIAGLETITRNLDRLGV